jgi:hypothetical protein
MVAEPRARPVNPNRPATIEIKKKINAHFSIYAPHTRASAQRAAYAPRGRMLQELGIAAKGETRPLTGDLDHRVAASVATHKRIERRGI